MVVFDGAKLPIKTAEESAREYRREQKQIKARELMDKGEINKAKQILVSSIDITPEMAQKFINVLKQMNVSYIVAPYEADAQLCYLDRKGLIDIVCTEDSDLIAYGCRKIIYKLDPSGNCLEIDKNNIYQSNKFIYFTENKFLQFCILSGCDFFKCPKFSVKTAYKYMNKYDTIEDVLTELILKNKITDDIINKFYDAYTTFKKQVVYCPTLEQTIHLNGETITEENIDFCGKIYDHITSVDIATAEINPINLQPYKKL